MFENKGFVLGTVQQDGRPVEGAIVALTSVFSSNGRLQFISLQGKTILTEKTDEDGKFTIVFLWTAADAGESLNNVQLELVAYTDAVTPRMLTVNAKGKTRVTGMILPNLMENINKAVFPNLTSLGGGASFGKSLIQAYRKIRIGPLHLPKEGMMTTEQYGIVGYAVVPLSR